MGAAAVVGRVVGSGAGRAVHEVTAARLRLSWAQLQTAQTLHSVTQRAMDQTGTPVHSTTCNESNRYNSAQHNVQWIKQVQ